MPFGSTLRLLRVDAGLSVRELARRIGVSSAYLSRVENGHDRAPTPDRLIALADVLGLPRAALVELAHQAGPAVEGYLQRVPAAGALFLEIARRDLNTPQLARVKAFIDHEFPGPSGQAGRRLADLLPPSRIIMGFFGANVEDIVAVAATRIPDLPGVDRRQLVQTILERERQASSCLGGGFIAPHAVIPGCPDAAVLLTMAQPIAMESPDQEPVRVAVVVVSGDTGPAYLEMLSRVARLASYDLANDLCSAATPDDARAIVEQLESLW